MFARFRSPAKAALKKSKYFDAQYYLATNRDVAASGVDPYSHYMSSGWQEGRNPSAKFNTLYYKFLYLSDNEQPQNPLLHFVENGEDAALRTAPASEEEYIEFQKSVVARHFNEYFYRNKNSDVPIGMSALDHYFATGSREGRDPAPDFSVNDYLQANSHITGSNIDPFFHYIVTSLNSRKRDAPSGKPSEKNLSVGQKALIETIGPEFDRELYLLENDDVCKAGTDPLLHYVEYGWREGRNPNSIFWTAYYLSNNPDIRESNINPFYHYLVHGRNEHRRPNPVSLALWPAPAAPSDAAWLAVKPAKSVADARITVIVPVYNGYDHSLAAIHAVLANEQTTPFELIVVNDCSPVPELSQKLRHLHDAGLFRYVENEVNLGFVGSVNRALEEEPLRDVILLNADALVYGDWVDRLITHADNDQQVATVTPLSNNATICSYPEANRNNVLSLEISPSQIDDFTKIANRGRSSIVPTGVGFCFYMRRSVIIELGPLDHAAFARGYGEENDFCMRALKAGYKNIFAHDVFVYHTGRVSFAGFAQSEYASGQKALLGKHPDYRLRVQRYISADPARESRMRLDAYRLAKMIGPNSAAFVTHSWEGGIKTHTRDLEARLAEINIRVVYIYAGKPGGSSSISIACPPDLEIYTPNLEEFSILRYPELLDDFLAWLEPKVVHVHSLAGLNWPATKALMSILQSGNLPYFYTGHDYSAFCHRNHLVNSEGIYCDQPPVALCRECIRVDLEHSDVVDPQERREVYSTFLNKAEGVLVPSADAASRIRRVFPALHPRVRPHEEFLRHIWLPMPKRFGPPLHVVVVGALGPHKGTGVLHDLALDAKQRSLPIQFTVVGYSHMTNRLAELNVRETGRYADENEAIASIRALQPHLALFPSIWPETYFYTLSLALAMGLPPIVFDLGAQADRVRAARVGRVLPRGLISDPSRLNDTLIALPLPELWQNRRATIFASYANISDYYERTEAITSG